MMRIFTIVFLLLCSYVSMAQPDYPPSPVCINGTSITVVKHAPTNIHAEFFDANSFDDTTPEELLQFSFSEDVTDTLLTIACPYEMDPNRQIRVYVTDTAGQSSFCTTYFTTVDLCDSSNLVGNNPRDTIPPVGVVKNGIESILPPEISYVKLFACEFNTNSYDNKTPSDELIYSFTPDTADRYMYFTCLDEGTIELDIYVTDQAGNQVVAPTYAIIEPCDSIYYDSIPPVTTCLDTTLSLSGTPPAAEIKGNELLDSVFDINSPPEALSYQGMPRDSLLRFDCTDTSGVKEYSLTVSDLYGNKSMCTARVQITDPGNLCRDSTTSAEPVHEQPFEIFPNPVEDQLTIRRYGSYSSVLKIIDMNGQLHRQKRWRQGTRHLTINTSSLSPGFYMVVIRSEHAETFREVIGKGRQ